MEAVEAVAKGWQIIAGIVTLVVIFAQMYQRIVVLEQKVTQLFDFHNQRAK